MDRPGATRPAGRYDERPRRLGRGPVAAIVVLATVFVGWVVWAALGAATPDVRSQVRGFRIVSDRAVSARIEVTADARRAVSCTLQAEDRTREPVGLRRLTVPAGTDGTRRAATTVTTRARAVTVVLLGCRLAPVSAG